METLLPVASRDVSGSFRTAITHTMEKGEILALDIQDKPVDFSKLTGSKFEMVFNVV